MPKDTFNLFVDLVFRPVFRFACVFLVCGMFFLTLNPADKPSNAVTTKTETVKVAVSTQKKNTKNNDVTVVPKIIHTNSAASTWLIERTPSGKFLAVPVSP
jgi:hypothetical protein